MMTRDGYHDLRRRYLPEHIKLVIIAESPPVSGKYFYESTGLTSEPLFAAFMQQLRVSPSTKQEGLVQFQRGGLILVDATYEPVNSCKSPERNKTILRDYPLLRADLERLMPERSIPIILIKANICRLLTSALLNDGFYVINRGHDVYFPASGRQKEFHRQFGDILSSAGIDLAASTGNHDLSA